MNAQDIAILFGFEREYEVAAERIGAKHPYCEGCASGFASVHYIEHQYALLRIIKEEVDKRK